jgi:hypothetical protein
MNDLNDDLAQMFRRREGDVRSPASAPAQLVVRTRRRERLTVGAGIAAAVIAVVVSIAGLRSLGSSDGSQPGDVGPMATTTVSGITITYPERWFAEDPVVIGIEPNDAPRTLPTLVLTLTRDDPHTQGVLGCPMMADVPPGQLLMTVQETPLASSGEASAAWPVPLRTWAGFGGDLGCYPGWSGMRASWTAAGRSFEARLGFSPDATDEDRAALLDAFASMSFAPGSVAAGETITLATGTTPGGAPWSLSATLDGGSISWTLATDASGLGASLPSNTVTSPSVEVHGSQADGSFAVAIVPSDVHSVDVESGARTDGVGVAKLPDTWGELGLAVIPLRGSGTGTVRFLDGEGTDVYPSQSISWGGDTTSAPSPEQDRELPWTNENGAPTSNGRFAGTDWKAEVLFYQGGVRLTIDGAAEDLGVLHLDDPVVRPLDADGFDALILVLTDTSVGRVSVSSEGTWDGRWMPASTGDAGEARLWIIEVPGAGQGTLLLDGQPSGDVRWP